MSFLKSLLYGPAAAAAPATETRDEDDVTDIIVAFHQAIASVLAYQDDTISAVYRGQQFLSDVAASLPMDAVNAQGQVEAKPALLEQPCLEETYHDSMSAIMASLIWDGNAYLRPIMRTKTGEITKVMVLDPAEVQVEWDRAKVFRQYSWRDLDLRSGQDIYHIAINRWPGRAKGVGPITAARLALMGIKAEANYARKLFEDDATPPFAIKIPQVISQTEATAILANWMDTHQGRKTPGVLGGGASIEALGIKPVDAEFLMSREFSVQEIARFLGVPAYFLGVSAGDSMTYTTTEGQFRHFLTATLNPTYLERIAATFTRLLPLGHSARFDVNEVLRADMLTRYQALGAGIGAGFLTVDEARASEGLAPLG